MLAQLGRRAVAAVGAAGQAEAELLGHLDDDERLERELELVVFLKGHARD